MFFSTRDMKDKPIVSYPHRDDPLHNHSPSPPCTHAPARRATTVPSSLPPAQLRSFHTTHKFPHLRMGVRCV